MAIVGPIILVDDDREDKELLREVLVELGIENKLIHFENCIIAFDYLKSTADIPFIIISDINLPKKNGIDFKRQIDEDPILRSKSIPFVFFSTSTDKKSVDVAYKEMTVQGFFQKPTSYHDLKRVIKLIFDYWQECKHPNA
ncbi:MAG: response regulator [Niastella sp.]|jgi:response regulator RpfG family c-di-GMP phosphodiesterase|uniref:response regulator n=1 Tax=Niastella sp. TaxID=1869183 RepID=UPI00389B39A2